MIVRVGAVAATGRRQVTREHPWSLSPAALSQAPVVRDLVLPSPNGSAISAAAMSIRHPLDHSSRNGNPGTLYDSTLSAHAAATM